MAVQNLNGRNEHIVINKEKLLKEQIEFNAFDDADIMNIIFGVDSNYIKYAAVTMLSIIKHNQDEKIAFHIFCDEIKDEDLQKIKHITEENPQISIIIYYLSNEVIAEFPQNINWNLAIYYRAIAPYILYGKVKRALYLDADILCLGNINDLFTINLPSVVGVVEDILPGNKKKKLLSTLGISSHEFYFNSGVMLIDVDRYFEENILAKFIDCVKNNCNKLKMYDQDAFNIILGKEAYYLDETFNSCKPLTNKKIVFLHFIGSLKPWALNIDRFGSDKWKEIYYSSEWRNVALNDNLNLEAHDCRILSKNLWRKKEYRNSVKKYLLYLMKKLRVV